MMTASRAGQIGADGPAEESILVVDADFGQVARVVADRHRLADMGVQDEVDVAKTLEVDPIALDRAGFRHSQQQQVELLQRCGQLWAS